MVIGLFLLFEFFWGVLIEGFVILVEKWVLELIFI